MFIMTSSKGRGLVKMSMSLSFGKAKKVNGEE